MSHLNHTTFTCNLCADPELKQISDNFSVCRVRVATSVRRKIDGAFQDKPTYITVEIYGNDAAYVAQYARKGSYAVFAGELEYHEWENRHGGGTRSELRLSVDSRHGGAVNLGPRNTGEIQQPVAAPTGAPPAFPPQGEPVTAAPVAPAPGVPAPLGQAPAATAFPAAVPAGTLASVAPDTPASTDDIPF
jgi:single stranded DNA-binding protein